MTWALPLELTPEGSFPVERPDPVADTARLVLGVAPGERRLLPDFGWAAHRFPDLSTPLRAAAAAVFAEEALRRWAPDLGIERVEMAAAGGRRARVRLLRQSLWHVLDIELGR